ncbi:putative mitochondrial carrier protein PET8 [Candida viswanathii]|uniref:Mitochondrial thiamine pyrophosphate carrier 1 n=1 Tax=Candida viswanathii TaxID=5486 RepID=A0A367YK69_9ASCO|nr:putative mitochondrial carrier protein PET8 [Candida viswanathii]
MSESTFLISLISGACAGVSTDLAFFPIDTIKTRLQAKGGFFANGGYKGIYRGLGSCVVASAPLASLFFVTYDTLKRDLVPYVSSPGGRHMIAASMGEIAACFVRVPAEVIKQRAQAAHLGNSTSWSNLVHILKNSLNEGVIRGLYRGWNTTIMREIPFTIIQFPLYEWLKVQWLENVWFVPEGGVKGAACGMIAGGVAAALTTPLDVIKTRIMLHKERISVVKLVKGLIREEGAGALFNGIVPRTCWISCGGAIFLGCYEFVHNELMKIRDITKKLE